MMTRFIKMKKLFTRSILVLFLLLVLKPSLLSQEKEKINPYLELQYFLDNDGNKTLKSTLTYSRNRMSNPVSGMKILFYSGKDQKENIGDIITDENGVASFILPGEAYSGANAEGFHDFSAEYAGNDTIKAASAELSVRFMNLVMELQEVDSIKNVLVRGFVTEEGKEIPVAGEMLTVYVPRMFGLLPVGEITLDETGSGFLEFPSDLPGDKNGDIVILAKIEDSPDYGTIEKSSKIKWGTIPDYSLPLGHRALWTKTAPRWMIYTLTILLTGVWGHYLYAIISLVRIKKDSGRAKRKLKKEKKIAQ